MSTKTTSHQSFTEEDILQIRESGLTLEDVCKQLHLFKNPSNHLRIDRPCTLHDGIHVLDDADLSHYIQTAEKAQNQGRLSKFVPASGKASRMFKFLEVALSSFGDMDTKKIEKLSAEGHTDAKETLKFIHGLPRFAFYQELEDAAEKAQKPLGTVLKKGEFSDMIGFLLYARPTNYANLPKGLLKFHRYRGESRTAFEEQLIESADYLRDQKGNCRVHFTVSPEHETLFQSFAGKAMHKYESAYQCRFQIIFSLQKAQTRVLAVDPQNHPARLKNGQLLFRPGGHGALLENLNDLSGDIVFIRNIDNVVSEAYMPETRRWEKIMSGYLLELQSAVFRWISCLMSQHKSERVLQGALEFASKHLSVYFPEELAASPHSVRYKFLIDKLNRPLRVCGMVENSGEPGGGPFWVKKKSDGLSLQIVEGSQIDSQSARQKSLFSSSTHFNPVDMVCGLKDWRGKAFDLRHYVDEQAVFISQKFEEGKEIKILELPGLWNGSMSDWNTVFVEVPRSNFCPVKTINDLLRDRHLPSVLDLPRKKT